MNSSPLVSIITPTYNHELFIGDCIQSLLAQEYDNWQQVIIDDGSTDCTVDVVRGFADSRITYIRQEHRGVEALAHSYNEALKASRGSLIAILEGDDTCPSDKLKKSVPAFADPDIILVYGEVQETTVDGQLVKLNSHSRLRRSLPNSIRSNSPVGSTARYMLTVEGHSLVPPASAVIRRSALDAIGGFQYVPELCLTDFPTFIMLALFGRFSYVPEVLGYRRMHSSSVSFCYLSNISSTQRRHVQMLIADERFNLTPAERSFIIGDWASERPKTEFTHGRIALLKKEWKQARTHFRRAMAVTIPRVCLAAIAGWVLSWLHFDLEPMVSATGRVALSDKNSRPVRVS